MAFRISDLNVFQNAVRGLQRNRGELARIQEQVSSQKRLASVGDEPEGAARIVTLRENLDRLTQFQRNIEGARSQLENSESALNSINNVLVRVRELAVSADVERSEFDQIQSEVEQRFAELLGLANTRVGNRYLFGGFVTDTAPITQTGTFTDPAPIVAYAGDSGSIQVAIDSDTQVEVNVTGRELFLGSTDGDDTADGNFVNLFDVVQNLRNRLADPETNGEPTEVLGDIDRALDQINQVRGRLGARANRLDSTHEQLSSLQLSVERERSGLEDVDLIEAITNLQSRESALQAALAVTGRVLQPSLLDFLS